MSNEDLARIGHDPDALERFYREHFESVQRFVARRVSDPQLAADLTTDIFLAVIDAADGFDPRRGKPQAWLFGISRNVIHNELRRSVRERDAVSRIQGRRLLDEDDLVRMQERIDAEAGSRQLLAAFESLPEGERQALELHAIDDLSPREVGEALGISSATVRVRLHRARRTLRRRLPSDESTVTIPSLET